METTKKGAKVVRTIKLEYLRIQYGTVADFDGAECTIKATEDCEAGDIVWILEPDGSFTMTTIC
jgi:hypothetical protein